MTRNFKYSPGPHPAVKTKKKRKGRNKGREAGREAKGRKKRVNSCWERIASKNDEV